MRSQIIVFLICTFFRCALTSEEEINSLAQCPQKKLLAMTQTFHYTQDTGECRYTIINCHNHDTVHTISNCTITCEEEEIIGPSGGRTSVPECPKEETVFLLPSFNYDRDTGHCHFFLKGECKGKDLHLHSIENCMQSCEDGTLYTRYPYVLD